MHIACFGVALAMARAKNLVAWPAQPLGKLRAEGADCVPGHSYQTLAGVAD